MKKNNITMYCIREKKRNSIAVLCLLSLTLVSCGRTSSLDDREIRFVAKLESSLTKTAYSGVTFDYGGLSHERIDWVENDIIRIWGFDVTTDTESWADYLVSSVEAQGENSVAGITPLLEPGLQWNNESDDYVFYSLYPSLVSPGLESVIISITQNDFSAHPLRIGGGQQLSWNTQSGPSVIGSPDMSCAYMFASAHHSNFASPVELLFEPIFTAFQFQISAPLTNSVQLTRCIMTNGTLPMSGTFELDCDYSGFVSVAHIESDEAGVVVPLPVEIDAGGMLDITILVLPQHYGPTTPWDENPDSITSIIFYGPSFDSGMAALDLTYSNTDPISFPPFQKYVIHSLTFPENTMDGGTKSKSPIRAGSPPSGVDSFEDGVVRSDGVICLNMADEKYNHEWY